MVLMLELVLELVLGLLLLVLLLALLEGRECSRRHKLLLLGLLLLL